MGGKQQQQYYNSESSSTSTTSSSSSSSNTNDDGLTYLSDIQNKSKVRVGPFGIDPLGYTEFVIGCLILWVFYLFIPRGLRFTYCGSYPKRYAWSDRIKRRRRQRNLPQHQQHQQQQLNTMNSGNSVVSMNTVETSSTMNTNHRELSTLGIGTATDVTNGFYGDRQSMMISSSTTTTTTTPMPSIKGTQPFIQRRPQSLPEEEVVDFSTPPPSTMMNPHTPFSSAAASTFNDEIAISTTMQQLRDSGIQIIAHGSRGKPKKVRLVLTENAIEWRTESKRKNKVGKMHQVPLTHIMYVDVGKATTALRRVENAAIPENVCLSLLTKDGSLDLEASSSLERDALVNCFSLVLDEVHAQNWRDVYRAPSSDMPSSFDEYDMMVGGVGARMEV
jgi:hypothetical protein